MQHASPKQSEQIWKNADCLYNESEVELALDTLAIEITSKLKDKNPLLLCTMIGGIVTAGKLIGRLSFPLEIDYIHATRYRGETQGAELDWICHPTTPLADRVILIVDDIFDQGLTLEALVNDCEQRSASEVYTAVLAEKKCAKQSDLKVDFIGLQVEDRYVFGYGMDYKGYLRNAAGIYAVADDKENNKS